MLSRPLAIALTILITAVWAANVVVGMLYPDRYDATVTGLFAIVVGVVFGLTPSAVTRRARAALARKLAEQAADDEPAAEEEPEADPPPPSRGDDQ